MTIFVAPDFLGYVSHCIHEFVIVYRESQHFHTLGLLFHSFIDQYTTTGKLVPGLFCKTVTFS